MTSAASPPEQPLVRHESTHAERLADLVALGHDLQFVIGCCGELLALESDEEQSRERKAGFTQALWSAAQMGYARCWRSGERLGVSQDLLDQFEGAPREWHQLMLDAQDKNTDSVNPSEEVTIGLLLSADGLQVEGVGIVTKKVISQSRNGIQQLARVAEAVKREVVGLADHENAVVLEEGRRVPAAELLQRESLRA